MQVMQNWRVTFAHGDPTPVYFVRDHEAKTESQAISLTARDLMRDHEVDWQKYKLASVQVLERVTE